MGEVGAPGVGEVGEPGVGEVGDVGDDGVGYSGSGAQSVNEKHAIPLGQSADPLGQGCAHDVSASSLLVPQKNVDEINEVGPVVTWGVGASDFTLHVVKGMHDSPVGQTEDDPPGHGTSHFWLASK